ncbi:MAG TPA: tRNA lysidine(34) synthetase TilS [Mycobacteriales bacterium]|nr:tRNA lysidine(34) synthetase TilS [Mycobacteriales bacterium]
MRHEPAVNATRAAVRACLAGAVADGCLAAGDLVLVAVSGGADSLALAAAASWAAPRLGLCAGAVCVDHGLQEGSAERAAAVERICRDLGLEPVVVQRVEVGTAGGPEAAARAARYAALEAVAERLTATVVLLGHTLDDQAETVLLGLGRGSGARSLAGMAPVNGRFRRPFLSLDRAATLAACVGLELAPWTDPHNADARFARVRVRTGALPALEAAVGPGVAAALARSAELLRADADALDEWAERALVSLRLTDDTGTGERLAIDLPGLAALPAAVRARVLRRASIQAGSPGGALSAHHVRELSRLVDDWHGQGPVSLPGGLVAARRCDRLVWR